MASNPSPTRASGRTERGKFAPGNAFGKGNPHARRVAALRSALLNAVTEDDMRAVIAQVVEQAKQGDMMAARVLFDRVLGRPLEADILERVEALEEILEAQDRRKSA